MSNNENNFTHGKIIFGSSPTFKIPMYIERTSIIVFRVDQVKYQEEDFTAELSLDFDSGGILVPGNFYKKIDFDYHENEELLNENQNEEQEQMKQLENMEQQEVNMSIFLIEKIIGVIKAQQVLVAGQDLLLREN